MNENGSPGVTIVSGLPRSGTSMMMQMLDAGSMPVLADQHRAADQDNVKGYYEFAPVKRTATDRTWLQDAVGKAVKVVYALLPELPGEYSYRVIFMRRNLDEVVRSQQAMLDRREERGAGQPAPVMAEVFRRQLERTEAWLAQQPNFQLLKIDYRQVILDPLKQANRVCEFLRMPLDLAAMAGAVDPTLYRQQTV